MEEIRVENGYTSIDFVANLGLEPGSMRPSFRIFERCRDYERRVCVKDMKDEKTYDCKTPWGAIQLPFLHKRKVKVCAEGEDDSAEAVVQFIYLNLTCGMI